MKLRHSVKCIPLIGDVNVRPIRHIHLPHYTRVWRTRLDVRRGLVPVIEIIGRYLAMLNMYRLLTRRYLCPLNGGCTSTREGFARCIQAGTPLGSHRPRLCELGAGHARIRHVVRITILARHNPLHCWIRTTLHAVHDLRRPRLVVVGQLLAPRRCPLLLRGVKYVSVGLLPSRNTAVVYERSLLLYGRPRYNLVRVIGGVHSRPRNIARLANIPDGILLLRRAQEIQDGRNDTLDRRRYIEYVIPRLRARAFIRRHTHRPATIITRRPARRDLLRYRIPRLGGMRGLEREGTQGRIMVIAIRRHLIRLRLYGGARGILLCPIRLGAVHLAVNRIRGYTGFYEFTRRDKVPLPILIHIESIGGLLPHLPH